MAIDVSFVVKFLLGQARLLASPRYCLVLTLNSRTAVEVEGFRNAVPGLDQMQMQIHLAHLARCAT